MCPIYPKFILYSSGVCAWMFWVDVQCVPHLVVVVGGGGGGMEGGMEGMREGERKGEGGRGR